jgi:putative ABC transport system permease protein
MIRNYFKIAWRNLAHNKIYSFINIFGLAIGMTFALLIGLWIHYETSYNTFHKNRDRIAMVRKHSSFNNEKRTHATTPLPLYDELRNNYPEVKNVTRMDWGNTHSIMQGDKKLNKRGSYVDPAFLEIFSFPLLKGNPRTAFNDPNSIILTASLARTLFGEEDAMGKMVRIDNKYNVIVTGIAADVPENSTLQFEFLAPFEFKIQNFDWIKEAKSSWGNNFLRTIIELKEGASMEALSARLEPLVQLKTKDKNEDRVFLFPLEKWHLYKDFSNWINVGGKIAYIRLFAIIGIFTLLIACINFMNLSTARSEKRSKEVGIRKTIGSRRSQLIGQFLAESVLTCFLAFLLSIVFVIVIRPYIKDLGFENIQFDAGNLSLVSSVLGICLFTGLLAGSYPALYLSSFSPIKVLKGISKQGSGTVNFRRILVVSQFVISIGLIISTAIVFQQIKHARNRSIGYNTDNLITIGGSQDLASNYVALKQELLNTGVIESVSKASSPMTEIYNTWTNFSWDGKDPGSSQGLDVIMTEWDYEKTVGLKIKQGRAFSRDFATDSNAVLLNEAAVSMIGYKDPVGRTMKLGKRTLNIVGIIENVVMQDPFKPVSPAVILFDAYDVSDFFIRLKKEAGLKEALALIKPIVEKHNPSLPFEYSFADEDFARKFTTENQVGKLAGIFAGLAIFISCLGLFGLAAFMAERRIKEIGIRKVLGASAANLWMLLSKEFIWLVVIACIIAAPVTFLFMNNWLEKYDYRINITWWVFIIAGLLALLIALLTVSTQAIRAAVTNPVKSLRTE